MPHMKPEMVRSVMGRHKKAMRSPSDAPRVSLADHLLGSFRVAGKVKQVPAQRPANAAGQDGTG